MVIDVDSKYHIACIFMGKSVKEKERFISGSAHPKSASGETGIYFDEQAKIHRIRQNFLV